MRNVVPIGRFSKVTRLSIKALRHYDELGLLCPALVDPDTGWRYYSLSQGREAEVIRLLREIDVPLTEIRELLADRDPVAVRKRLEAHRARVRADLRRRQRVVSALDRLISQEDPLMTYPVHARQRPAQPFISLRAITTQAELSDQAGRAFRRLFEHLDHAGVEPAGAPFARYHGEEFDPDRVEVEFAVPVREAVEPAADIETHELKAATVATTLHEGSYAHIGRAFEAVAAWIQERGHTALGPPEEIYLVHPVEVERPEDLRTEIAWPIR
ncbi:MAG: MerR family transcriptional regulator [Solirubrobacterales bacterium]|nr:MerR family transcriptional regulator [Solirubrobacterales bacterium]